MTQRELYVHSMKFGRSDRVLFYPGGPREATLKRWHAEGLPEGADWYTVLLDELGIRYPEAHSVPIPGTDFKMIPMFEEKVLSHENGHYIVQDWMGAITEISDQYDYTYIRTAKDFVTRKWHKFPVEARADWKEMQKRYKVEEPARFDPHMAEKGKAVRDRDFYTAMSFNGPFWQLREWMGFEGLCTALMDDPALVMEMAEFWGDFVYRTLEKILPHYAPDRVVVNEDMAYKAHSMISPRMARQFLMPCYKLWLPLLKKHGCPVVEMDSDGYVGELIPLWIEAGFDACSPMEVAAHNDIVEYRRLYGRDMAYWGGVDKRCIAKGGRIIEEEMKRIAPVLEDGGFVPSCDHGVPHDISWPNFVHYSRLLARMTGWL